MPYKIVTAKSTGSKDILYDVIDTTMSRGKKTLKLFPYEEAAEQYARNNLKKKDDEFKVIEVESAYDYQDISPSQEPDTDNES